MYINFNNKLNKVLKRHYVDNATDVENLKKKVKSRLKDAREIVNSIEITTEVALEFSVEFFERHENIKKLKNMNMPIDIKETIEEIERIYRKYGVHIV